MGACCTLESGKAGAAKQSRPTTPKSARRKSERRSELQVEENATLHDAAWEGNLNMVRKFLIKGHSPDLADEELSTPLHLAAEEGYLEVVKCLVEEGKATCADAADSDGNTPLLLAAKEGREDVVNTSWPKQNCKHRTRQTTKGRLHCFAQCRRAAGTL